MATDFDTIAAISTPPGEGGIGIVRLSGDQAVEIADRIYQMGHKRLKDQDSHTIHYGYIHDPQTQDRIDEVMVSVMRAPKTYTREDVVEINCHGGMLVVSRVLHAALAAGARLAEPGEFTKRAFLNGRLDLSQAEAVMDIIHAKSEESMDMAMNQLAGHVSQKIGDLRAQLLDTIAKVEVNIDYPEYDDVEEATSQEVRQTAEAVRSQIQELLDSAKQGQVLREGLKTAIIGQPNVGKSSLLNALLGQDKAIVTDIAGTTRDLVEDYVTIQGIPLKLIDTAGIRESQDQVEQIGIQRSKVAIDQADLVLLVLNASQPLDQADRQLIDLTAHTHRIIILNKVDLEEALDLEELQDLVKDAPIIATSMVDQSGLDQVEEAIVNHVYSGQSKAKSADLVSNARHIDLLNQAQAALDDLLRGLDQGLPVDLVQIDLTRAWELLGEITGEHVQDELLDKLFSEFCLGK